MNKLTVVFDYRTARKTRSKTDDYGTVELGDWLDKEENKRRIYNTRGFYVVLPAMDHVVKYGICGEQGKSGSWGRLHSYVIDYGTATELNPCRGVKLLYLAVTNHNPNVETINSAVYRKEKAAKDFFRSDAIEGRGFERIFLERISELFKIVDSKSNKSWEDIETERRTSERLAQANITPEDKVMKIISHDTKGNKSQAKTKYKVQWSRPYILTEKKKVDGKIVTTQKQNFETMEPANKIITYLDGSKQLELYHILHPDAKFRD